MTTLEISNGAVEDVVKREYHLVCVSLNYY